MSGVDGAYINPGPLHHDLEVDLFSAFFNFVPTISSALKRSESSIWVAFCKLKRHPFPPAMKAAVAQWLRGPPMYSLSTDFWDSSPTNLFGYSYFAIKLD